jgi:hypothetical protein
MQHPGKGLVQEDAKVPCSDGGTDCEEGVGMRGVAEGEGRDRVSEATAATAIAEGDEVGLIRVDAKAAVGHPVNDILEVGSDKVGGAFVVAGNSNEGAIINVELSMAVCPPFCQTEEGGCVDGGKDGGERGALRRAIVHGVGQAHEAVKPQGCRAVGKEGEHPRAEGGWVAEEME